MHAAKRGVFAGGKFRINKNRLPDDKTSVSTSPSLLTTSSNGIPFTGISQYASTFQSLLNTSVQTAEIPITQLQNEDSTILSREASLGSLQSSAASLTSSLNALAALAGGQALSASSSNASVVTATATGATAPASYTINSVTTLASAASEVSTNSYANGATTPVSNGTMTLVAGGRSYTLNLAANNLNSLVSAINGAGAGVTASVITDGASSQLSISSNGGPESIQLYDGASPSGTDLITNTGSGTETSIAAYADPASTQVSKGVMTLVAGSHQYTFALGGNNLVALEQAINAQNAGVTASILTTSTGDYLSVSANQTGATTLALYDGAAAGGTDLLTRNNQGSNAQFQLDGISISNPGNTINSVIPGVTFTLTGESSAPATISLASDPSQLSSALQNFVSSYNSLQTAVQAQEGQNAGPLAGDSVVGQLQTMLNQIAAYTNIGGGIQSLADLGVDFNSDTGQLSFDQTTFDSLSQSQIQQAFQFLGSSTTGFGAFANQLSGFSDPVTGLIQAEITGEKKTDSDLQSQIANLENQVRAMQTSLTQQFENADALQQELENQQSTLSASLNGLNLVLYGRNTTSF